MIRFHSIVAVTFLLAPGLSPQYASSANPGAEPQSSTIYAKVSGMMSTDCEVVAEESLAGALETLLEVEANHETGWIKIELAHPDKDAKASESEGRIENSDDYVKTIAESIRTALEKGCGFKLEAIQTKKPEE